MSFSDFTLSENKSHKEKISLDIHILNNILPSDLLQTFPVVNFSTLKYAKFLWLQFPDTGFSYNLFY